MNLLVHCPVPDRDPNEPAVIQAHGDKCRGLQLVRLSRADQAQQGFSPVAGEFCESRPCFHEDFIGHLGGGHEVRCRPPGGNAATAEPSQEGRQKNGGRGDQEFQSVATSQCRQMARANLGRTPSQERESGGCLSCSCVAAPLASNVKSHHEAKRREFLPVSAANAPLPGRRRTKAGWPVGKARQRAAAAVAAATPATASDRLRTIPCSPDRRQPFPRRTMLRAPREGLPSGCSPGTFR